MNTLRGLSPVLIKTFVSSINDELLKPEPDADLILRAAAAICVQIMKNNGRND